MLLDHRGRPLNGGGRLFLLGSPSKMVAWVLVAPELRGGRWWGHAMNEGGREVNEAYLVGILGQEHLVGNLVSPERSTPAVHPCARRSNPCYPPPSRYLFIPVPIPPLSSRSSLSVAGDTLKYTQQLGGYGKNWGCRSR